MSKPAVEGLADYWLGLYMDKIVKITERPAMQLCEIEENWCLYCSTEAICCEELLCDICTDLITQTTKEN